MLQPVFLSILRKVDNVPGPPGVTSKERKGVWMFDTVNSNLN